jgi:hypothetical protein
MSSGEGYLKSLENIRNIEWSKSWLWDVRFPKDGPKGFESWFPAVSIEENLSTLEPFSFNGGYSTFEVPKSTTLFDIKMTFIDDIRLSVEHWLDEWVNQVILGGGEYVACLEESVRQVEILKLNSQRGLVAYSSYLVFPKGALYFSGNSEVGNHSSEVEFVIAGTIEKKSFI